jgi:hypothetical protein
VTFEDFRATLAPVRRRVATEEIAEHGVIRDAAQALADLPSLDRDSVAALVQAHPEWIPAIGLAVSLSQESLKNQLRHHFDTGGHVTLGRERPQDVVAMLDDEFGLIAELEADRSVRYTFGDILMARAATRQRAGEAIRGGRDFEDLIEGVAQNLDLSYELRTRFVGRNGQTAPCDLAIPVGGDEALIVCAAKGFDSTGSKLTDAVREIEEMANVRLPRQFVYAVVDGIGWGGRRSDLRRIYELYERQQIDGVYTVAMLNRFVADVSEAASRLGLK